MTRAFSKALTIAALAAALLVPLRASAALVADPQTLYNDMKASFDKGAAHGWAFFDQLAYLSAILNAGRAYSLQAPDDPNYAEVVQLTVDVGSRMHYNPLTNHDAAIWYVREASLYVQQHGSTDEVQKATELLKRTDAEDQPQTMARLADQDATANLQTYAHDPDALIQQVEADWRAYLLTHEASWRSSALERAAKSTFPIDQLPTTWGPDFLNAARNAAAGVDPYTLNDQFNARRLLARLKAINPLHLVGSVNVISHEKYMTITAPADEYFGRTGMSILGMRNELHRLNAYLDAGWGAHESPAGVLLAESVDDLHKVYPRDHELPALLLATYKALQRIPTTEAHSSAGRIRSILTVEYQDTQQARELLSS
ncbi:MAG: hypothetical protein JO024_03800 [Candidatus Eremiobacteraeota bacterium]|nr:hypothetical protein [Candidatus Eremiobacteraeota bacterium]MBV9737495.1 hypothetical protein [Candidatus Eremiobacteraeota bacterium]